MSTTEPPPPSARFFSAAVEGEFCAWGGLTEKFYDEEEVAPILYSYNPIIEGWARQKCSGGLPPNLCAGASVSSGHHLYIYGGLDSRNKSQCSLHHLDHKALIWRLLSSAGPTRKSGCEMVTHKNRLILFGGFSDLPASTGEFTNELHTFDIEEGESGGGRQLGV